MKLAEKMVEESRQNRDIEKLRLDKERQKFERALLDAEDDRYIRHSITAEDFDRLSARYRAVIKSLTKQLDSLDLDYSSKLRRLERILSLAEDLQRAYHLASPDEKREYLQLFFEKFIVKDGKVSEYILSKQFEDLIKDGSVRVSAIGLRGLDEVRTCLMSKNLGYIPSF